MGPNGTVGPPSLFCLQQLMHWRACDEDETNIILLHLVEYLGHTNSLINGLAYDEVYEQLRNKSALMLRCSSC